MEIDMKMSLRGNETLVGTALTLPSTEIAEIMSQMGWDFLWIDIEHAPIDFGQAQRMIQAAGGRCPSILRLPESKEVWIKKALDIGSDGIVVPQIKDAAEAQRVVDCSYYPPLGRRSAGVARAHGYGMSFDEYIQGANDRLAIVLQIENTESVDDIDSILKVKGVDALLIGPLDLSASLGVMGQTEHPVVKEAIERVMMKCREAGMPLGIYTTSPESAKEKIQEGFQLIVVNDDVDYLWRAASSALDEVRGG